MSDDDSSDAGTPEYTARELLEGEGPEPEEVLPLSDDVADEPDLGPGGMMPFRWLASYPKSGNTWMRMLLESYFQGVENHKVQFDDLVQWGFQSPAPRPVSELNYAEFAMLRPALMMHLWEIADVRGEFTDTPKRMYSKTHHFCGAVQGMPLWSPCWADRVIYIVRDPRDVAPSLADYMGVEMDKAIEMMADPNATIEKVRNLPHMLGSWSQHVSSWQNTERIPVHTVRFEDMKEDVVEVFRGIIEWLPDVEVREDRLAMACGATEFSRVQRLEAEMGFQEQSNNQEQFFRKGKADQGDELTREQEARIIEQHSEVMERMGYDTTLSSTPEEKE